MTYPKLFSPIKIGKLELANRVVYSPCGSTTATEEGYVTDRMVDLYTEYASGGASLVCVEDTHVNINGGRPPFIYNDSYIEGFTRLTEAVHKAGSKAAIHLGHLGRCSHSVLGPKLHDIPKGGLAAPSAIAFPQPGYIVPREMTIDDILQTEDDFAQAALRGKKAGFDVIWLHGAHSFLINNFLSPESNKRQDEYGGSFNNRLRFLLEVIQKIKNRSGMIIPLWSV